MTLFNSIFWCGETGCVGGGDAGVVQFVPPKVHAHTIFLFFLWSGGSHQFGIDDFAIRRYLRRVTKLKCIGAGGHARTDSLGEAPKVVG